MTRVILDRFPAISTLGAHPRAAHDGVANATRSAVRLVGCSALLGSQCEQSEQRRISWRVRAQPLVLLVN
jgi:hypothetical protein